jgi:tetratricopeptide (TPR) repeat protein
VPARSLRASSPWARGCRGLAGSYELSVAEILYSLGDLYQDTHRDREAEEFYRRALVLSQEANSIPAHLASSLDRYASLLRKLERYTEAERVEARLRSFRMAPRGGGPTS